MAGFFGEGFLLLRGIFDEFNRTQENYGDSNYLAVLLPIRVIRFFGGDLRDCLKCKFWDFWIVRGIQFKYGWPYSLSFQ